MMNKKVNKKLNKGFTLVELLVVIVIIGILAGLGLSSFTSSQKKGRDARRKADLDNIVKTLETYYNDKDQYPVGDGSGRMLGCGSGVACDWGGQWLDNNGTYYMVQLPADLLDGYSYYYTSSDGSDFQIYARLENLKDPAIPKDVGGLPLQYTGTICTTGGGLCNFGIASSNSSLAGAN